MKTFMVTGGAGFIGSNYIRYMLNKYKDINIINLDKLTYAGNLENLSGIEDDPNYRFIKGDICNESLVGEIIGDGVDLVNRKKVMGINAQNVRMKGASKTCRMEMTTNSKSVRK